MRRTPSLDVYEVLTQLLSLIIHLTLLNRNTGATHTWGKKVNGGC